MCLDVVYVVELAAARDGELKACVVPQMSVKDPYQQSVIGSSLQSAGHDERVVSWFLMREGFHIDRLQEIRMNSRVILYNEAQTIQAPSLLLVFEKRKRKIEYIYIYHHLSFTSRP